MKRIFFILLFLVCSNVFAFMQHDKAAYAAQCGDWDTANKTLQKLVIDNPDDPTVLYDAGVAAAKSGDLAQAGAYFDAATACPDCDLTLQEQSYFNAGMVAVQQKKYEDAIKRFEKALQINPDNERTKHNYALTQFLQEQEKQKQENDENNSDQNDQEEKKEQSEQQQDKKQKDDSVKDDEKNSEQGKQESETQYGDQEGTQDGQGDNRKKEGEKQGNQREDQNTGEQSQSDREQDLNGQKNDMGNAEQENQRSQHGKKEEKDSEDRTQHDSQDTKKDENEQGQCGERNSEKAKDIDANGKSKGAIDEGAKPEENDLHAKVGKELMQILQQLDAHDERGNKELIRARVSQEMAGQDGQNCW